MNRKLLAVVIIILLAVIVFGLISSNMDYVNSSIPEISNKISTGDINYNNAVKDMNNKQYDNALNELNTAKSAFSGASSLLNDIKKDNSINSNDVYSSYLEATSNEVNYKENASSNLLIAVNALKNNNIPTGNNYIYYAGNDMSQALIYQQERNQIVESNHDKFNNNTINI
ncbi:hypothetical protein [Methanobrevibacter wolinii]|uniref:hypothetical protein n=1 Tax=Methanobrevibacter wolinii TaxID=190977 RepID=UPI000694F0E2|nr:hypothetical protein [Methanobrevibacter wolinii]